MTCLEVHVSIRREPLHSYTREGCQSSNLVGDIHKLLIDLIIISIVQYIPLRVEEKRVRWLFGRGIDHLKDLYGAVSANYL